MQITAYFPLVLGAAVLACACAAQPTLTQALPLGIGDDVTHDIKLADLDGDGDLDAVVGNATDINNAAAGANSVYLNDGQGNFTLKGALDPAVAESTYVLVVADFDADGDADVLADGRIYRNDGAANFTPAGALGTPAIHRAAAGGDLDGDADIDLVVLGSDHEVWLNDGAGGFTMLGAFAVTGDASSYALADLDGNGDLDMVVSTREMATIGPGPIVPFDNQLWLGDGAGGFFLVGYAGGGGSCVAACDLDADADLDVVIGIDGGLSEIWENVGVWNFTLNGNLGVGSGATAIATADMDGDGDQDLLLGNWSTNRMYLNNGGLNFAQSVSFSGGWTWTIAAGDVNGDARPDLLVGNGGLNSSPQQNWVVLNDPQGGGPIQPAPSQRGGGGGCTAAIGAGWGMALLALPLLGRRKRRK